MRGSARLFLLASLIGSGAAACTYFSNQPPAPYRPPGVTAPILAADAGHELFQRDCAWCHGPRGAGTAYGPELNDALDGGAYTDFMLRTGRMPLASPRQEAVEGPPRYSEQQIAAIVSYVETLGGTGPGVQNPNPSAGSLSEGQGLYQQNCAACHSTTGVGGALTSGQVAPSLRHATPREVAEAVLVGPGCENSSRTCGPGEGAMPRFDLTQQQIDSIARYVQYLQHPEDEGGASIGLIGPVAEGAVGLLIGLGILLLVVRWIGTRVEVRE
jgi:ubiquinol-cytochrome c reductase cytochrome c subunit